MIFVVGVLLFNGAFFYYSFSKLYALHRLEKEVAVELASLEEDKIIYTFYLNNAFESYGLPNQIEGMWQDSLLIIPDNYVVFNSEMFKDSWKGSPVMNNWNRMNSEFEMEQIKVLPQNWKLYRIK